eukprot:NODE_1174_length_2577_cov_3.423673.p1 GENE.NODE_1174_length_2577_cov_3.423673~~NODE_1174_length_2577_cov_3.423673.p1  ORF type:complete len:614 (+),score=228.14 NODE_1174_length_2577_cov_3.423673:423-2264(+)
MQSAAEELKSKRENATRMRNAVEEAARRVRDLMTSREAVKAETRRAQDAVARASRHHYVLEDQVQMLNESIRENFSTITSAWRDSLEERFVDDEGWSPWAKKLVVRNLAAFIAAAENFIDKYLMTINTRAARHELANAEKELAAAEEEVVKAEAAVLPISVKLAKATDELDAAEVVKQQAPGIAAAVERLVAPAEKAFAAANKTLEGTKTKVLETTKRLEAARKALKEAESAYSKATAVLGKATAAEKEARNALEKRRNAAVHAREALLAEAAGRPNASALEVRGGPFDAEAMRKRCGAKAAEMEAYLPERELLGYVRAGVAAAKLMVQWAASRTVAAEKNVTGTEAARVAAQKALDAARLALRKRGEEEAAAVADVKRCEDEVVAASKALAEAQQVLWGTIERKRKVFDVRELADKNVTVAVGVRMKAALVATGAANAHNTTLQRLQAARNVTAQRAEALATAEVREVEARIGLEAAREILARLVEALRVPAREARKEAAVAAHKLWVAREDKAMRFAMLNKQVQLEAKNKRRTDGKTEFYKQEKDPEKAADILSKAYVREQEHIEHIERIWHELQEQLKEHDVALELHAAQDPVERTRSFQVSLEGTGAEP